MSARTQTATRTEGKTVKLPTAPGETPNASLAVVGPSPTWRMMGETLDEGLRFAETLLKSGLMPKALDSKEKVYTVLLKGRELGIQPLIALAKIYVIGGNAIMDSQLMMGICQSRGVRFQWKTPAGKDKEMAVVQIIRPDGDVHIETFTYEYASEIQYSEWVTRGNQREKVSKPLVQKDNWKNSPIEMLRARCAARGIRWFCADYVFAYLPDEIPEMRSEEADSVISDLVEQNQREAMERLDKIQGAGKPLKVEAEVVDRVPVDDVPAIDRTPLQAGDGGDFFPDPDPEDDDKGETAEGPWPEDEGKTPARASTERRQEPKVEPKKELTLAEALLEQARRAGCVGKGDLSGEIVVDFGIAEATGVNAGQYAPGSFDEKTAKRLGTAYKVRAQKNRDKDREHFQQRPR